jgi:hypothetical protein
MVIREDNGARDGGLEEFAFVGVDRANGHVGSERWGTIEWCYIRGMKGVCVGLNVLTAEDRGDGFPSTSASSFEE